MSVSQSEWPYMAIPLNMWVAYVFWSDFSMWIQWWCPFHDQSDHKMENRSTFKCYICSEAVFHCEFNENVHFTIRVTIYGKTTKHVHVIYVLWCFWIQRQWCRRIQPSGQFTHMFRGFAIYGHSDCKMDITIQFALRNHFRTHITLTCLAVLPYMVTVIAKRTSPFNSHGKTTSEHI